MILRSAKVKFSGANGTPCGLADESQTLNLASVCRGRIGNVLQSTTDTQGFRARASWRYDVLAYSPRQRTGAKPAPSVHRNDQLSPEQSCPGPSYVGLAVFGEQLRKPFVARGSAR